MDAEIKNTPFEFRILEREECGLVCEYQGVAQGTIIERAQKKVAEAFQRLTCNPRFLILDHSRTIPGFLNQRDVRSTALRTKELMSAMPKNFVIALVAPEGLAYGLARMWHSYLADEGRVNVLKTRAEAESWISEKLGLASQG